MKNGVCDAHGARESDPLFKCTFTLCSYQTKRKCDLHNHMKIHSDEYIKRRKLEEIKIEKLLINNEIDYKREHTVSYSCIQDIENRNSRIDFVIEHTDIINKNYGLLFLEVDEHQHESYPGLLHVRYQECQR